MNAAEDLLAVHLTELGLHFERQFKYAKGRKFNADFAVWYPAQQGWPHELHGARFALIEVQGGIYKKGKPCLLCGRTSKGAHGSVTGVLKDNERLFEAFKAGWHMIRVTPQQVESGEAKEMVRRCVKE